MRNEKIFHGQNISREVENYIDVTTKPSNEMVEDLVRLCKLEDTDSFFNNVDTKDNKYGYGTAEVFGG